MLLAGFIAEDVGRGAICMTATTPAAVSRTTTLGPLRRDRAPHLGAQADVIMGQNLYFVEVGQRSFHSLLRTAASTATWRRRAATGPVLPARRHQPHLLRAA